ncbi:MAG: Proline/betaine transporter [uncultured Acidimicrobiales bacterium]|uniref:Proline/betaine transporter n=1 Tax=uncultured Acidimicrobiales bacterium TaxID=310071 RepID=A0A6J4I578_9ACTN|nr:MAG: Proline/betaine transporter [uncultured Acidimicrobiales bacterium]
MQRAADESLITPQFALVTVVALAVFVGYSFTIPVLPRFIEGPLGGGSLAVGIGVGVLSVSAVLGRPFFGRVGDRSGRKVLILAGALAMAVGTGLLVVVDSYAGLILLRLLVGAGEGAFFVGAATLVNDLSPPHRRGEAHSYFSVAVYLSLGLGPLAGELLLDIDHYDRVWIAGAVVTLLGLLLATRLPAHVVPLDDEDRPVASRRLVHPAGLGPGLVIGLGVMGYVGFSAFVPLYVDDLGLGGAGPVFAMYAVIVLAVRLLGARLPDRLGPALVGRVAIICSAVGLAFVAAVPSRLGLYLGTAVLAVGMSLMYPALITLATSRADDSEQASVIATFTGFFDLAAGAGGALLGGVAAATGYRGAFAAGAAVAMSGLIVLARVAEPSSTVGPGADGPSTPRARG